MTMLLTLELEQAQRLLDALRDGNPQRRAASSAEAVGAALLNAHWRRIGMSVDTRPAHVAPRLGLRFLPALLMLTAAGGLSLVPLPLPVDPSLLTVTLDLTAVLLFTADPLLRGGLRRLQRAPSQTIIAVRHREAEQQNGLAVRPHLRVVLATALDSARAPGLRRLLQGETRLAWLLRLLLVIPALLVSLFAVTFTSLPWWLNGSVHLAGVLLLAPAVLFAAPLRRPDGNLVAQAAVTAALERLEGLRHVELWAVGFGGGNVDHQTVDQLLQRFPFQPNETVIVVIGPLYGRAPQVVRRAGMFEPKTDFELYALAERADRADPAIAARPSRRAAALPLVQHWMQRGFRVVQLSAESRQRADDSSEAELVVRTSRLLTGLVQLIEGDPHALRAARKR